MADNPDNSTETQAPPSGVKAILPLILALVVGVGAGGGLGVFVAGPFLTKGMIVPAPKKAHAKADKDDAHGEEEAEGEEHAEEEGEEGGEEEESHEKDGKKADAAAAPEIHTLENMVINPANTGGARFLLVSVAIEAGSTKALEKLKARDAELRDAVLSAISRREVESLTDIGFRDSIKVELAGAINARFGKKTVKRLFFPQWVIQ